MKLVHDFAWKYHPALMDMLDGTSNLDKYLRKLRKFAVSQRSPKTPDGEPDETQLKIIGDGFELFGEAFVKICGRNDPRIAIRDYKLLDITDNGVDARGLDSKTGQDVFIQYKCYNPTELLTGGGRAHLDSFVAESLMMIRDEHVDPGTLKQWPRLVVITSAAGIHEYTKEKKYRNRVECYPIDQLKNLTSLPTFWEDFKSLLQL